VGEFTKIGEVRQFRQGRGRAVRLGDREIAVFRRGDRFFAMDDTCPHMGASLAAGRLVGDDIECEWHHWKFDLTTGRNAHKSWACVTMHEVRVEGDDVLVKLAEPPPGGRPSEEQDDEWFVWDPDRKTGGPESDPGESR
jgi:nitrite reductase (NADH) small subunit/3-phenylpropionate/trans-cinnamate dioxygenase ferredoxin subunit